MIFTLYRFSLSKMIIVILCHELLTCLRHSKQKSSIYLQKMRTVQNDYKDAVL